MTRNVCGSAEPKTSSCNIRVSSSRFSAAPKSPRARRSAPKAFLRCSVSGLRGSRTRPALRILTVFALFGWLEFGAEQGLDQAVHGYVAAVQLHQGESPEHADGRGQLEGVCYQRSHLGHALLRTEREYVARDRFRAEEGTTP